MTFRKAQAGIENLMMYGWAVAIIMVIGVLLWNAGIFSPASAPAAGFSGFAGLRPLEWFCTAETDTVTIILANTVGANLQNVSAGGTPCEPARVTPGDSTTCVIASLPCCAAALAGSRFDCPVDVSYTGATGIYKSSYGRVWGPAE